MATSSTDAAADPVAPYAEADSPPRRHASTLLLAVIAAVVGAWIVRELAVVLAPLAAGFFIMVLVQPVDHRLRKHGGMALGVSVAMALVLLVTAAFVATFAWAITMAVQEAPTYGERIGELESSIQGWAAGNNLPVGDDLLSRGFDRLLLVGGAVLRSGWSALAMVVLALFVTLLLLLEADRWREKVAVAFPGQRGSCIVDVGHAIAGKLRQYLLVQSAINVLAAVLTAFWLLVLGVDFALLWAVMTAVLYYIPYLGATIAIVPPALTALAQYDPLWAGIVFLILLATHLTIGNVVGPRALGKVMTISPVVLIFSMVFWGWAWGPLGVLLAVPMAATTIIVFAHVPSLRAGGLMLSDATDTDTLRREAAVNVDWPPLNEQPSPGRAAEPAPS